MLYFNSYRLYLQILILIALTSAELKHSEETKPFNPIKTNYIPTAVSYVSFVRHIVPKRVEHLKEHTKPPTQQPTHAPIYRNAMQTVAQNVSNSYTKPYPQVTSVQAYNIPYRRPVTKPQTAFPNFKNSVQPTANTYRPIYPTGYAEPIYVQSRIPLVPKYSGTLQGTSPLVIGVQQPAYVRKYVQFGPFHPTRVRKTLTYAPKLSYVPHDYQRV